jgi:D-sedoheptulose 7-phosphate isomerase
MTRDEIIDIIRSKRDLGKSVFICGNGGSAANAEHFATDLFKKGVRAYCLGSNSSIITMIANDYGYENIFSLQLRIYAKPGDLVVLISCSGTSANIVKARKISKLEYVEIYGGEGSYEDMESAHSALLHKISEAL